jgi:hypothetical protein
MKKALLLVLIPAGLALWAFFQASPVAPGALAGYCPPGALLYLEAKDFAALLQDWKGSPEKKLWLASANYQVFSRSRLFGRLERSQQEFSTAAGVPPDMELVDSVAGGNSAIAFYDIGKLEFIYLTRLPSARALESALWKTRSQFEPRNAAGQAYYVRVDTSTRRVAAFAAVNDLLLIATREDLVAGALALIAGQAGGSVKAENWFDQAVRAAGQQGELRLVLNMTALAGSAHFRSYWIQRNVSDLRAARAAVIDLHRSAGEYREERVFVRSSADYTPPDEAPVAQLVRLVPDDAGLYRAWAGPGSSLAAYLIRQKILDPRGGAAQPSKTAPSVWVEAGTAGSESDLETRIDEMPLERPSGHANLDALERLMDAVSVQAVMEVQSSRVLPDGVFVDNDPVVVLLGASDWNAGAVRAAIDAGLSGGWGAEYALAAQGRILALGRSERAIQPLMARVSQPAASQGALYTASYRHSRELANYERMMRLMDNTAREAAPPPRLQPSGQQDEPPPREPQFFSENVAGLGRVLGRVRSATIVVHDGRQVVSQTVTYKLQ